MWYLNKMQLNLWLTSKINFSAQLLVKIMIMLYFLSTMLKKFFYLRIKLKAHIMTIKALFLAKVHIFLKIFLLNVTPKST